MDGDPLLPRMKLFSINLEAMMAAASVDPAKVTGGRLSRPRADISVYHAQITKTWSSQHQDLRVLAKKNASLAARVRFGEATAGG